MVINGRKVLALYDDMTGGGTSRLALAGNDTLPQPWAVIRLRRDGSDTGRVLQTSLFCDAGEARRIWLNRVQQYVPEHLTADPRFF